MTKKKVDSRKKVYVMFINMVNPSREIENLYPPLGPAYLASYCNKYLGKKIKFELISNEFEKNIKDKKPDIVGISSVSQNYGKAIKLAQYSKSIGIPLVMIGGSHISLYPKSLDKIFDLGVVGEGEVTFLELMKIYLKKRKLQNSDKSKVSGIVYWDKDNQIITEARDLIMPLDLVPQPDRSLFKINKNKAYIFSSRGCPYRCVFCASSRLWKRMRFHSAEYVFDEIKTLVNKYGVTRIDFYDDLFIADKKRIADLVKLIEKANFDKKVQFHISARANLVTDEMCALLKRMNVGGIGMGLESGSPKILNYLKGDTVNIDDNRRAVEIIKKHGLYCVASFIIGTPLDTRKTILETLDFIRKSKLDEFMVYSLTPLPGTPVWDYAVDEGIIQTDPNGFNWERIDVEYSRSHSYNYHLAKKISRKEFHELYHLFELEMKRRTYRRAAVLLFTNPSRFAYHLTNKIRNLFHNIG